LDVPEVQDAFSQINERDWYQQANLDVFKAIQTLVEAKETIDMISVMAAIPERKSHIVSLQNSAVKSFKHAPAYVKAIREKAIERNAQIVLHNALDTLEMEIGHSEKLDRVNAILKDLDKLAIDRANEVVSLKEHLKEVVNELSDREEGNTNSIAPLQTGYFELDTLTGGFGKGELITLGARTSVGKSAFGQNVAENIARQSGKRILYITMEMTGKDLAMRSLCSLGRVDNSFLRETGKLNQQQWDGIIRGVNIAAKLELHIAKMARPTVEEIKSLCRSVHRQQPFDLIVIDHLHLMSHKKTANEVQGIGDTTAELKGLALELELPILLMAQLNRGNAKENRPPAITDLRGSGSIEQDSDRVLLLHRTQDTDKEGIASLMLVKNRGGKSGIGMKLKNSLQFFRFDNMDSNRYSGYEELGE